MKSQNAQPRSPSKSGYKRLTPEFVNFFCTINNSEDLSSFEAAFCKLDIDGDGTLCQNEVLDIIPAEDLGTLLKEMDQDGDGKIDYGVW